MHRPGRRHCGHRPDDRAETAGALDGIRFPALLFRFDRDREHGFAAHPLVDRGRRGRPRADDPDADSGGARRPQAVARHRGERRRTGNAGRDSGSPATVTVRQTT